MRGLNVGSGQRPFDREQGWINIDIQAQWNPDIVADWNKLDMIESDSCDYVVSHHSLEHVGCGEADEFIRESHRVLKERGSLIVIVPDPRTISQRFLTYQLSDSEFNILMFGAFMGNDADRHRWSYTRQGLWEYLKKLAPWRDVHVFNWRPIPGADIAAPDWWFHAQEAIK